MKSPHQEETTTKIEFQLVRGEDIYALMDEVDKMLAYDWALYGQPFSSGAGGVECIYQAFTRDITEQPKPPDTNKAAMKPSAKEQL